MEARLACEYVYRGGARDWVRHAGELLPLALQTPCSRAFQSLCLEKCANPIGIPELVE